MKFQNTWDAIMREHFEVKPERQWITVKLPEDSAVPRNPETEAFLEKISKELDEQFKEKCRKVYGDTGYRPRKIKLELP